MYLPVDYSHAVQNVNPTDVISRCYTKYFKSKRYFPPPTLCYAYHLDCLPPRTVAQCTVWISRCTREFTRTHYGHGRPTFALKPENNRDCFCTEIAFTPSNRLRTRLLVRGDPRPRLKSAIDVWNAVTQH